MTQSADVIIPSFSAADVRDLPLEYRMKALYLAQTGRVIIGESSEKTEA